MPAHCGSQDCFNQLDLIHRVPEEPWTEARDIVQEAVIKTVPKKNTYRKERWLCSCEKKRSERQRRKGKIYVFECRVPKNSKER